MESNPDGKILIVNVVVKIRTGDICQLSIVFVTVLLSLRPALCFRYKNIILSIVTTLIIWTVVLADEEEITSTIQAIDSFKRNKNKGA